MPATRPYNDTEYDALPIIAEHAEQDIYNDDEIILFTWNPNPKKYHSHDPRKQYKQILPRLARLCKCCRVFAFSPELTMNGNLHIHGWYVLRDKIKYYRSVLPMIKGIGNCKIEKASSKNALVFYYKKTIIEMHKIINYSDKIKELPIPLTHENFTAYDLSTTIKKLSSYIHEDVDHHKKQRNICDFLLNI